ncbi:MAG: hypothetical protein R3F55_11480 [Alphaproteobacteria bacterium]
MQIFLKIFARGRSRPHGGRRRHDACRCWCSDPLAHPALRAMTADQLADLPFDPRAIDPGDACVCATAPARRHDRGRAVAAGAAAPAAC